MSRDGAVTGVSDTGAWQRISEALMLGVFHDISSRVSALSGIARMARMELSFEDTLLPLLESEVAKLARAMELAKLLPRQPRAEPVSIGDLVPLVLKLHRHHPDLDQLEYRYDARTPGAVVDADSTLCHSLLAVFSLLGWSALRDGYSAVDVQVVEEGGRIVVKAERAGASAGAATGARVPDDLTQLTDVMVRSVRLAAEQAGGEATAETEDGQRLTAFELRLPPIRRGQRAG